jgi:hypothetical protein
LSIRRTDFSPEQVAMIDAEAKRLRLTFAAAVRIILDRLISGPNQARRESLPTSPETGLDRAQNEPIPGVKQAQPDPSLARTRGEDSSCISSPSPYNPEKEEKTLVGPSLPREVEPVPDPDDPGDVDAQAVAWIPIVGAVPAARSRGPARRTAKGWEYGVTQELADGWAEAYPGIDVLQALRACRQWNVAAPARRKTYGGVLKHINGWLAKEQDSKPQNRKAGGGKGSAIPTGATSEQLAAARLFDDAEGS